MVPDTGIPFNSPFKNIALCLSGGGYRAATFALGTFDMLEELGMMKDVKLLSTVSGGTFTGVMYAAWMSDGHSFAKFYRDLYGFLRKTNCINDALDGLYTTPSPSGMKNISLIRSAAALYDRELFKGQKFGKLQNTVGTGTDKRFLELIFNATEFRRGNSFRFRASYRPKVKSGNGDLKVEKDVAGDIRLADIVAASSCFPAAFEPLRFPEDFVWSKGLADVRTRLIAGSKIDWECQDEKTKGKCISVPLMDGGIYDNQGITNAQMADEDGEIFDLFVICDTSTRNHEIMDYPSPDNRQGLINIGTLFWGVVILYVLMAISAYMLINELSIVYKTATGMQIFFQFIMPILVMAAITITLGIGYRRFREVKTIEISGQKFGVWNVIRRMKPVDAFDIGKSRIGSLVAMSNNVFMKRIRDLQNKNVRLDDKYRLKVVSELVYTVFDEAAGSRLFKYDKRMEPTPEMREISRRSEEISTSLWFEHAEEQDRLIVCGQMTICFSLLKNIWVRWEAECAAVKEQQDAEDEILLEPPSPLDSGSKYREAYERIMARWENMKKKPDYYLNRKRDDCDN